VTPSKLIKRLRLADPDHFRLAAFDPADTGGLDKELEQVRVVLEAEGREQANAKKPSTSKDR
jgi:hypothetical protein